MVLLHRAGCVLEAGMHSHGPAQTQWYKGVSVLSYPQVCQVEGAVVGRALRAVWLHYSHAGVGEQGLSVELGCLYSVASFFLTKTAILQTLGVGTNLLFREFTLLHVFYCNRR